MKEKEEEGLKGRRGWEGGEDYTEEGSRGGRGGNNWPHSETSKVYPQRNGLVKEAHQRPDLPNTFNLDFLLQYCSVSVWSVVFCYSNSSKPTYMSLWVEIP